MRDRIVASKIKKKIDWNKYKQFVSLYLSNDDNDRVKTVHAKTKVIPMISMASWDGQRAITSCNWLPCNLYPRLGKFEIGWIELISTQNFQWMKHLLCFCILLFFFSI